MHMLLGYEAWWLRHTTDALSLSTRCEIAQLQSAEQRYSLRAAPAVLMCLAISIHPPVHVQVAEVCVASLVEPAAANKVVEVIAETNAPTNSMSQLFESVAY